LDPLSAKKITGRPAIQWAAVAAAREKVGIFAESYLMEYIFNQACTYFTKNS
jgi:hypothetical protein